MIIRGDEGMKKEKMTILTGFVLLAFFVLFTIIVKTVDVRAVGPQNSPIGLSGINKWFFDSFGASTLCYYLTEAYGYLSMAVMVSFAGYGLWQLIKGKSFKKVDTRLWILAGFYAIVLGCYVFFEKVVINYRPVILDEAEGLEASYPSSHVVLILCVMGSTRVMLSALSVKDKSPLAKAIVLACDIIAITAIVGRLLSGVHWLTDIFAGIVLSSALVIIFRGVILCISEKEFTKGL